MSRESPARAESLIAAGWNLLIFPEGGRSPDGWGQTHRGGAAWLAARSGRPLVPVHIKGTGRLLPRGAKRVYMGSTKVTFGAPIAPDLPARQLVGRLEEAMAVLGRRGDQRLVVRPAAGGQRQHPPAYRPRSVSLAPGVGAGPVAQGQRPPAFVRRRKAVAAQALSRRPASYISRSGVMPVTAGGPGGPVTGR